MGSRFNSPTPAAGFAAMSCATLREMFDIDMRYFSLTMLISISNCSTACRTASSGLNVDHLPADVRRFFIERDLAAIVSTVRRSRTGRRALCGRGHRGGLARDVLSRC